MLLNVTFKPFVLYVNNICSLFSYFCFLFVAIRLQNYDIL